MTTPSSVELIDAHDAALFDLDGVIYLGPAPVGGAAEGVSALRDRGVRIGFVTNNAARTPGHVVAHLNELGVSAELGDVVTAAQAVARVAGAELPAGAPVLVVGTDALAAELTAVGLTLVTDWREQPAAVVQGYDPTMTQARLDAAGFAIQRGSVWFASNTDATRPTDLGLVPGAGSQIASVAVAVDIDPIVAGKPYRPLMDETVARLGASRPIFVGDRLDTDIAGANGVGMASLFVFTGAHGKADLAAADALHRPTHLGFDLRALLAPARTVTPTDGGARCGAAEATVTGATLALAGPLTTVEEQLDALAAALSVIWRAHDAGQVVDAHAALTSLTLVP